MTDIYESYFLTLTKEELIENLKIRIKGLERDLETSENKIKEDRKKQTDIYCELSTMYVKFNQLFEHDNLKSILNKPLIPLLSSIYDDLTKVTDIVQRS